MLAMVYGSEYEWKNKEDWYWKAKPMVKLNFQEKLKKQTVAIEVEGV